MVRHYTDKPVWTMPPLDTSYVCDGRKLTLKDMLDEIDPDYYPETQADLEWLLFCYGEGETETMEQQKARYEAEQRHFILVK